MGADTVSDEGGVHAGGPSRPRWRRAMPAVVMAGIALIAASVLTGPPGVDGPALEPRSTAPTGLAGLLDLASSLDRDIDIATDLSTNTSTHLLIGRDLLGAQGRAQVMDWVADGGRLVVADPGSQLHGLTPSPGPISDMIGPTSRAPDCEAVGLGQVHRVTHDAWSGYEAPGDGLACFGLGEDAAWLVARSHGRGEVVALGSPAPLVNDMLDRDDNAALAAALLFPTEHSRVEVLPPDPAAQAEAAGEQPAPATEAGVADLLPDQLPAALVVAVLALGALLLALGRRLGPPVEERLPPTLPSAELARSVGDLLQRAGSRDGAARRLRHAARRHVVRVLGAGDLAQSALADHAAYRLALDPAVTRRALVDLIVDDDDELTAVADAAATVHQRLARTGI